MPSPWTKANDVWADAPTTSTPILAAKLQHIDDGVYDLKQLTWKLTYDEPTNVITMAGSLRANAYYVSGVLLASTHLSDGATLVKTGDTGTISNAMLANSAVSGAKIQTSTTLPGTPLIAVDPTGTDQTLKIASTQWVRAAIATYAPGGGGGSISDNSITNVKLFDKTVTNAKIADGTIIQSLFPATMIDGSAAVASLRTLGTGAAQAAAGNDSRLSDTRTPTAGSVVDASVAAGAAITWTKISKTGSSLADLTTRSAADLSSGTLLDARLSANVHKLDAAATQTGSPFIIGSTANFRLFFPVATDRVVFGLNSSNFVSAASQKRMQFMRVDTDTQPAISIQLDGTSSQILFGPGGAVAPDANLYRGAVDTLKTDDTFNAVGYQVAGVALAASHLSNGVSGAGAVVLATGPVVALADGSTAATQVTGDNSTKVATTAWVKSLGYGAGGGADPLLLTFDATARNGVAAMTRIGQVGPSSQAGIAFGSALDAGMYREAVAGIATDGYLAVRTGNDGLRLQRGTSVTSPAIDVRISTDTVDRLQILHDGTHSWGPGNAVADVNLYRSAANVLRTDDTFDAAAYRVAGTALAASHLSNGVSGAGAVVLATGLTSSLAAYAPLASPALTGTPTAPTPVVADDTTKIATTAWVKSQGYIVGVADPLVLNFNATARSGLATQVRIGAVGPGGEAAIDFGSAGDARIWRATAGQVGTQALLVTHAGLSPLIYQPTGNANPIFYISTAGALNFGAGGATPIDVSLYRSAAAILRTNGSLVVDSDIYGDLIGSENPVFDIRWFGADAAAAHQTTAIVNAVTAAKAKGGDVYFPPGVQWKVNASVTLPSSVGVIGQKGGTKSQSLGSVITQAAGYTGSIFTLSDPSGFPDFIDFRDIHIFNQGAGHGIYVPTGMQATHVNFDRVMFTNYTTGGGNSVRIDPGTAGGTGTERWYFNKCTFAGGGINDHHVYVTGTFFDKSSFNQCVWRDFTGYAVVINTTFVRTFGMQNCVVDGLGGAGSQCRGSLWCSAESKGINIYGHYSENCGNRGTTALITVEGDFVFSTAAYLMGHISAGYLNDGGGSTTMNFINIPNNPGGNIVATGVFKVNGTVNDPNTKLIKSGCNF